MRRALLEDLEIGPGIRLRRLEPRRVLNASFEVIGGTDLALFDFADGAHLDVDYDGTHHSFTLSSGTWFEGGVDSGNNVLSLVLTGKLSIQSALATNIALHGDLGNLSDLSVNVGGHFGDDDLATLVVADQLKVSAGSIQLDGVSYQAGSHLVLESTVDSVSINAQILSNSGGINVIAANSIFQSESVQVLSGSDAFDNSILMNAIGGSLEMTDAAWTATKGGNIHYWASQDVILSQLNSSSGSISVIAGMNIVDLHNDTVTNTSEGFSDPTNDPRIENLTAASILLQASGDIGVPGNPLDTFAGSIALSSGNHAYILESDSITVNDLFSEAKIINWDGTSSIANHSLSGGLSQNGHLKLETLFGSLNVNQSVTAAQDIFLAAGGDFLGDANINASVTSQNGALIVLARQNVEQIDNLSVSMGSDPTSNSIFVRAQNGYLGMASNAVTSTNGGHVRYQAGTSMSIGQIDAGEGSIALISNDQIYDSQTDTIFHDPSGFATQTGDARIVNLRANGLHIDTQGAVGETTNPLDTDVKLLSANVTNGLRLFQSSSLTVDSVAVQVSTAFLNSDSDTVSAQSSGLTILSGGAAVETISGNLAINQFVDAWQDILLVSGGTTGDILLSATVTSQFGRIGFLAADDVLQNANIVAQSVSGEIHIRAMNQNADADSGIVMTSGRSSTANGGVIRLASDNDGDIRLGYLNATASGGISLVAEGSIFDNNGHSLLALDAMAGQNSVQVVDGSLFAVGDLLLLQDNSGAVEQFSITSIAGNALALSSNLSGSFLTSDNSHVSAVNVRCGSLYMIADATLGDNGSTISSIGNGTGQIGDSDLGSGQAHLNRNAIDTITSTVTAHSSQGIYIQELNSMAVNNQGTMTPQFSLDGNFSFAQDPIVNGLNSANGPIKVATLAGSLQIDEAVSIAGSSDILLEARGASSDLLINASVTGGTGDIALVAGRSMDVNAAVSTGGSGTLYLHAAQSISVDSTLTTQSGDALISAGQDLSQSASVSSTSGDIALLAAGNITQTASGHVTASGGDVLIQAGNNWNMAGTTTITSGGSDLVGQATNGSIQLGVIHVTNLTANRVALSSGVSILDANASAVNIQETIAAATTSVSLRAASGSIGQADAGNGTPQVNDLAIDLNVDSLAALSATGIYLREVAAGGALTVGNASAVTVTVDAQQVHFNSTQTAKQGSATLAALAGASTTGNGPIKAVAEAGTLTVQQSVTANGNGDILLEARGASSDLLINASVTGGTGDIALVALDDITIDASVTTSGLGTTFVLALNHLLDADHGIVMTETSVLATQQGNIRLVADNEGDILLGLISAGNGTSDVSLLAEGNVLDNNASSINIRARALMVVADALIDANGTLLALHGDSVGQIGLPDTHFGIENIHAIDTQVSVFAARSATGIFVQEQDHLEIGSTGSISTNRQNFNSTHSSMTDSSLSDLRTFADGSIKIVTMSGTLTVNDGHVAGHHANDAINLDGIGVVAGGSGDIHLESRGETSDLIIQAELQANQDTLWLSAGRELVTTGRASADGTEILFSRAIGQHAVLVAGTRIFLPDLQVSTLEAEIHAAKNFASISGTPGQAIIDGLISDQKVNEHLVNQKANSKGPEILNNLQHQPTPQNPNVTLPTHSINTGSFDTVKESFEFTNRFSDGYAMFVRNHGDLTLKPIHLDQPLSITGKAPGVYIESLSPVASVGSLMANVAAGQTQLQLSNVSGLNIGEVLLIQQSANSEFQRVAISAINQVTNTITVEQPILNDLSSAQAILRLPSDLTLTGSSQLTSSQIGRDPGIVLVAYDQLMLGDAKRISQLQLSAATGASTLQVIDGSQFQVNDFVSLVNDKGDIHKSLVTQVLGNTLTLQDSLTADFTTGENSRIVQAAEIDLLTPVGQPSLKTQTLNTLELNASAYHGGQGGVPASSRYVLEQARIASQNIDTHLQQRVRAEFGSTQESGFMSLIHYADNAFQMFDQLGHVARLEPSSDFLLQTATTDLAAIENSQQEPGLFARDPNQNFAKEFLFNNKDLQTEIIVRRSLDLFLFSGGGSESAANVVDHTSYFQEILNVQTLGQPPMGVIVPIPDPVAPPDTPVRPNNPLISAPAFLISSEIEFPVIQPEIIEVAIYRIPYEDANLNGQVDATELPTFDSVLTRLEESPEYRETKISIEPRNSGEAPTQGEIEEEKVKLQSKPDQPSGAYAIIRKSADGKEEILEVFSLRDWPEPQLPTQIDEFVPELPELPAFQSDQSVPEQADEINLKSQSESEPPLRKNQPENNDTSFQLKSLPSETRVTDNASSMRFAQATSLISPLLMLRVARSRQQISDVTPAEVPASVSAQISQVHEGNASIGFGRRDRRLRKFRAILSDRIDQAASAKKNRTSE